MAMKMESVGRRIQEVRELRQMSVGELAAKAGLAKSYIAKLERGEVENPGVRTLASIAAALGVTLGALLRAQQSEDTEQQAESDVQLAKQLGDARLDLPDGLRELAKRMERKGAPLPQHVINALALVEFRGKRPKTVEDWLFLLNAVERSGTGK